MLPPAEAAVADAFTRTTLSVANVVDITVAAAGGGVRAGGDALSTVEGNGSGVVWDADGTVVTNWHVLGGVLGRAGGRTRVASAARITLLDAAGAQHTFVADCIGADRGKDLAVLRVSAPREFVVPISRGSRVRVGQTVLAIGNPFGYDHVLTTGVVSGLERSVASAPGSLVTGAIQTDAAINPGNSGGPLLDSSGNLVGLNTAIFSPNGSTGVGVGFAIPVSTLERAVPQLIEFGRIIRPTLGISLAPEGIASQLRVKGGALVQAAVPGGPGERAGLLPTRRGLGGIVTGDVIVGIDDDPVRSAAEFNEVRVSRRKGAAGWRIAVFCEHSPLTGHVLRSWWSAARRAIQSRSTSCAALAATRRNSYSTCRRRWRRRHERYYDREAMC